MKRMKGLVLSILILAVALSCVCCSGKKAEGADYSTYMGKEYSGQDPWGNPLSIKLTSMEGSTVSFEYKDVIGEDAVAVVVPAMPQSRRIVVGEGSTLPLGRHTLSFIAAPMVHWPEVVMTYDACDKILFSADGFELSGTGP